MKQKRLEMHLYDVAIPHAMPEDARNGKGYDLEFTCSLLAVYL